MNPKEYQRLAVRTCIPRGPMVLSPDQVDLLHAAQGLNTEAGEAMDALKKHFMYSKPMDLVNFQEELGDVLWYIGMICERLGWDMGELMEHNIKKLQVRFPDKFTEEAVSTRNLDAERRVLEGQEPCPCHDGAQE